MQRCIPSYAPVLGLSLISSAKRRVGFNRDWKAYLWLGLKLEYLGMHSCCAYTMVSIRATLSQWSWVQHPFLSWCTPGRSTCFGSGAFADGQDVTARKAPGVDPRLIWSLQEKSRPLAFYPVSEKIRKKVTPYSSAIANDLLSSALTPILYGFPISFWVKSGCTDINDKIWQH